MVTSVAGGFTTSSVRRWSALALVAVVVGLDWLSIGAQGISDAWRAVIGANCALLVATLTRASRVHMGFRLAADPSWGRLLLWGVAAVLIFLTVYGVALGAIHSGPGLAALHLDRIMPRDRADLFLRSVVLAPIIEEPLYRFALCPAAEATVGRRAGIALSGVVFGLLHVVYGHPSVANVLGGFFLGWIFYRSRSMLVPALAHGLGNGILAVANYAVLDWIVAAR